MFTLSSLANNDKIYAAITWDRRVLANGDIVSTITSRTVAKAATLPTNDPLTATRYYQLATVTLGAGNIPVIAQSRWGPIDDLPGTATSPYLMPPSPGDQADAQTDYYDLTVTGKGKNTDDVDLAPTYDSVQMNKTGFVRFVTDDGDLKAFVRPATINSIGQITFTGPEDLAVDFPPLTFEFGTLHRRHSRRHHHRHMERWFHLRPPAAIHGFWYRGDTLAGIVGQRERTGNRRGPADI